jgi:hypothetical protein
VTARNDPAYIEYLEGRIARLESAMATTTGPGQLPRTQLLSPKFLTRAFAVWGHMIVAQLAITIPVYAVFFIIAMIIGVVGSTAANY